MENENQATDERRAGQDAARADTPAPGGGAGRRLVRRAAKAAAMCALMLAAAEAAGVIFLRGQGLDGDAIRREKAAIYELLPTLQYVGEKADPSVLNRPRELHPFFGFVLKRDQPPGNNHGFWNDVDFPYVPTDDELVVGVFGGSVAVQVAFNPAGRSVLEERFAALGAQRGFKSARVLALGESGWRQPQSFNAFCYYLNMVDVAVVVDGFNEVTQMNPRSWPARYPWLWRTLSSASLNPEELVVAGEISGLSRLADKWTALLSGPVLGRSAILHCIWREGARRILRSLDLRREELAAAQAAQQDYTTLLAATDEEALRQRDDYYRFYERLSRTQAEIARLEGVAYYHFIQPSRLVRDSKPWSAEEQSHRALNYERSVEQATAEYERLRHIAERLARSGVSIHYLRDVFHEVRQTVYRDETVHLNDEGLVLLTTAMMDQVARDFRRQPLRRSPMGE